MMRDPVCLMELDPRRAAAMAEHRGYAYYFCSAECKQAFVSRPELYKDKTPAMRLTVGVMGSAGEDHSERVKARVRALGQAIAQGGYILITGACPGLPYECAVGARQESGWSVGVSPALSLDEHVHEYHSPTDMFDVLIYTGSGLMGREVTNIRSSDMVVIAGGSSGTLGEFAIAYDEGKLIGVLRGSGGITEEIPNIITSFGSKNTGARVIFDEDPVELIRGFVMAYIEQHYRHPSCFCRETKGAAEGDTGSAAMK